MKTDDRTSPTSPLRVEIMTILFDTIIHEYDENLLFNELDYAQPLSVEPSADFIILTQWDGTGECQHCILVERRDKQAFIEALMRA